MRNLANTLHALRDFCATFFCVVLVSATSSVALAKNSKNISQEAQTTHSTNNTNESNKANESSDSTAAQSAQDILTKESKNPKNIVAKNIVGGVAIKVNGDPITLYEIKNIQKQRHFDKSQAVEFLIAQRLKTQEIERLKINVDDERLDREIENIASQNQMNMQQFMLALQREGIEYDLYRDELKDQIETRELMRNVLLSAETSSEDEIHKYYNEHKSEFNTPKEVEVARYSAKNPKLLERTIANPNTTISGVEKTQEKLELSALNPQIAQLFSSLKEGRFSQILDAGGGSYVTFRVVKKHGQTLMSFEEARQYIAQKLSQNSQEKVLSEYFEKIKQKAHIQTLREP